MLNQRNGSEPQVQMIPETSPQSLSLSAVEVKEVPTALISMESMNRAQIYNDSIGVGLNSSKTADQINNEDHSHAGGLTQQFKESFVIPDDIMLQRRDHI